MLDIVPVPYRQSQRPVLRRKRVCVNYLLYTSSSIPLFNAVPDLY